MALRLLCRDTSADCGGLAAVVRRRRWREARLKKRLVQLDIAFAFLCHVTEPRISKLMEDLHVELAQPSVASGPVDVSEGTRGSDHVEGYSGSSKVERRSVDSSVGFIMGAVGFNTGALAQGQGYAGLRRFDLSGGDGEMVDEATQACVSMAAYAVLEAGGGGSCSDDGMQGAGVEACLHCEGGSAEPVRSTWHTTWAVA